MKKISYLILAGLFMIGIYSCKKDSAGLVTRTETLSLGAGYTNDIFYRLSDGLITSVPRSDWDIAFIVSARESAILINDAAGVELKAYPVTGWVWTTAIDTTGYHNWTSLVNSDTTWTDGAFNMNATGHPNYGWGNYNSTSHNIEGSALYIIKLRNGNFKKIWIEMKYSALQKYSFRYADLDGSNEQVVSNMDVSDSKANFVYYNLQDNLRVDREPETSSWDIVFTKWIDKSIHYPVTGVLQNIGVRALESSDVDPLSESFPSEGYLSAMSTIGSDWKTINMNTFQYTIDETRVFLIKDKNNKIYRIRFKTFEGSATGNLSFDISTMK
jgi:hypothetical protein